MRGIRWLPVLLCVLSIPVLAPDRDAASQSKGATAPYGESESFGVYLEEQIPPLMDRYEIPGVAIALIEKGTPAWSRAFGFADLESGRPMTVDAIFRVESLSKPVTAWGVMKLAERGLIHLDDPIQEYLDNWTLPESEFNLKGVTIRRLLSNSAGMPLGTLGEEYPPGSVRPSLKQYLTKEAHLDYEPGSKFQYSNPGFNLLELLIEEVTGRDFNEYMEQEVLIPLGMRDSSFNWNEGWTTRVPLGYDLQGNPVASYVYPYRASGGLYARVDDIAQFVRAGMISGLDWDANVLSKQSIQVLHEPQVKTSGIFSFVAEAYGFGHFIETLPNGSRALWHGGQGHGWMTHFHMVPETGDGIVILTNSQRSWPFMARVLNDWSTGHSFGSVKFGRIATAATVLRIGIGVILLFAFWKLAHVVRGGITGSRKLAFSQGKSFGLRIGEFSAGVVLGGILIWAVSRDYLFITSIFPIGAVWLGWSLLFLSLVLLASAMFPVIQKDSDFND